MTGFEQPYFIWALLALPVLAMVYIWWRRSRRRMVSALFLWDQPEAARQSGTRLELRRLPASFYVEALVLLLLTLGALAPFWIVGRSLPVLTVILDDSFSMQAVGPNGTPLELGRAELLRRAAEHPSRPVRVILAGTRLRQLGEYDSPGALETALRAWRGGDAGGDLTGALALARSNKETGELLVISDRAPAGPVATDVGWYAAGTPLAHTGIVTARRWHTDGRERVLAVIANNGMAPVKAVITLEPGAVRRQVTIDGGDEYKFQHELDGVREPVTIRLEVPQDPLAVDRAVTLQSEFREPLRLWIAGDILDFDRELIVRLAASNPAWSVVSDPQDAEVVFTASASPAASGEWHRVIFHVVRRGEMVTEPFTIDRRHPLTDGVDMAGVRWYADRDTAFPGLPAISGEELDLMGTVKRTNNYWDVHWNADFRASNLTRSTMLPVLFWNLAQWLTAERPGPSQSNYPAGQEIRIRLPRGAEQARLRGPDGETVTLTAQQGMVTCPGLDAGLWELQAGDRSWRFAVQALDARESNLRISGECKFSASQAAPDRVPRWRFGVAALVAALALLALHQYHFGKWRGETA